MHKESGQKALAEGTEISVLLEAYLKAVADRDHSPISLIDWKGQAEIPHSIKELLASK